MRRIWMLGIVLLLSVCAQSAHGQQGKPFRILVRDAQTKRGVPMVKLTTTNNITFITDSAGMIAFDEPGMMNTRVHFTVESHGYLFPEDGFKIRGKAVNITPGGSATFDIQRVNIAERLYRVTGGGQYRDSLMLGDDAPIEAPVINGLVSGQDSVQTIVYDGLIRWFWGDTGRPAYPLGNFEASGAVSELPGKGGLDPSAGINLQYFVGTDGFSRPMIPIDGPGPVWLDGLMTVPDQTHPGRELLLCHWVRVKTLGEMHERGLAAYDDATDRFKPIASYPTDSEVHPSGHPIALMTDGKRMYYFGAPFPFMRVPATLEAIKDQDSYTTLTAYKEGTHDIQRDADGHIVYDWKANTEGLHTLRLARAEQDREIGPDEWWFDIRDVETGDRVLPHGGSVAWNPYRQRWVAIILQTFGEPSFLGEIWYAEADTPLGPWVWARRVVTHDHYSFYNPKHHPFLDQDGGRLIYFEGTYTSTFSATDTKTPRYDYNQIMYRLSLDDSRTHLPAPVYVLEEGDFSLRRGIGNDVNEVRGVAFFAISPQDTTNGYIAVYGNGSGQSFSLSLEGAGNEALFYAMPANDADAGERPSYAIGLYAYRRGDGAVRYAVDGAGPGTGWKRGEDPLCFVWPNPLNSAVCGVLAREGLPLHFENTDH
ncbi:MAG: hypothetical protein D8M59_05150 [Planctomycetes bacterium]|nr:hypothetical protein [Planctomycetota bacterium]NOG56032.1 hypothetical protein [Planctomycetota bacterium]